MLAPAAVLVVCILVSLLSYVWLLAAVQPATAAPARADPHAMEVAEFARGLADWDRKGRP